MCDVCSFSLSPCVSVVSLNENIWRCVNVLRWLFLATAWKPVCNFAFRWIFTCLLILIVMLPFFFLLRSLDSRKHSCFFFPVSLCLLPKIRSCRSRLHIVLTNEQKKHTFNVYDLQISWKTIQFIKPYYVHTHTLSFIHRHHVLTRNLHFIII